MEISPSASFRRPTPGEVALLAELVRRARGLDIPSDWPVRIKVCDMDDGGMGSFSIDLHGYAAASSGPDLAAAEVNFTDADGTAVIATLYVNKLSQLREVDIWRVDFNPLIRIPSTFE